MRLKEEQWLGLLINSFSLLFPTTLSCKEAAYNMFIWWPSKLNVIVQPFLLFSSYWQSTFAINFGYIPVRQDYLLFQYALHMHIIKMVTNLVC